MSNSNFHVNKQIYVTGTFFPDGWLWCQSMNNNNSDSISIVGGKFTIGVDINLN